MFLANWQKSGAHCHCPIKSFSEATRRPYQYNDLPRELLSHFFLSYAHQMAAESNREWGQLDWPRLLEAARASSGEAISEVFERLNSYCLMVAATGLSPGLASKLGASDIVQKSMLEALSRLPTFSGCTEAEIRSWMATIINRNVIDAGRHFRDAKRRSCKRETNLASDERNTQLPARCQPPSYAMRRQEEDSALLRAIAQLGEKKRRAVELRFHDGLSHRQIAAALHISEVAARKLCSRAIEDLRKALATEHERPSQPPSRS
jgi:RNA polymerase sigma-70 factor (ECF subfamily)